MTAEPHGGRRRLRARQGPRPRGRPFGARPARHSTAICAPMRSTAGRNGAAAADERARDARRRLSPGDRLQTKIRQSSRPWGSRGKPYPGPHGHFPPATGGFCPLRDHPRRDHGQKPPTVQGFCPRSLAPPPRRCAATVTTTAPVQPSGIPRDLRRSAILATDQVRGRGRGGTVRDAYCSSSCCGTRASCGPSEVSSTSSLCSASGSISSGAT